MVDQVERNNEWSTKDESERAGEQRKNGYQNVEKAGRSCRRVGLFTDEEKGCERSTSTHESALTSTSISFGYRYKVSQKIYDRESRRYLNKIPL